MQLAQVLLHMIQGPFRARNRNARHSRRARFSLTVLSLSGRGFKTAKAAGNFFLIVICRLQRFPQTVTLDSRREQAGFAQEL
ncbi:MAG TPA: hypothetical protein VMD29_01520, partial [Terracidiphilus sp.]|nr:hypothetical protein [Terracidiphilus sp.]